jgi:O-methyltransferase
MNIDEMLEAVRALPFGDYAECGVWKGYMAQKIAAGMDRNETLWLFDSFQGHGEPGKFDDPVRHPRGRYADTSIEEVCALIPRAVIIPGFIPDTLIVDRPFRFVHIDLDHYLPTKAACEFFKPRMVAGGIIRFDDYGFSECPGATKAVNEVFGRDNVLSQDYRWVNAS